MANNECIRVGRRIKSLRLKKGWMQIDLAVHTGLTRETISNIERGRKEPGLRSLAKIAKAFKMTPSQLLRGL